MLEDFQHLLAIISNVNNGMVRVNNIVLPAAEAMPYALKLLRNAAEILAAVPNLIIGEPGSKLRLGEVGLRGWPAEDEGLTVPLWQALAPIAPRFASSRLKDILITPGTVAVVSDFARIIGLAP